MAEFPVPLQVSANRAALNPMEPLPDDLGTEDSVLKVVELRLVTSNTPCNSSAPLASMWQHGVFQGCSDGFFSNLPQVEETEDGWLVFSSPMPMVWLTRLYIRSSFRVIADQAVDDPSYSSRIPQYVAVSGTSGIGKSAFLYYLMWRLAKQKRRVLFLTLNPPVYFDGAHMLHARQLPPSCDLEFWSPDLWCLVNSVDVTHRPGFPIYRCSVLLASTPPAGHFDSFDKLAPGPRYFYMPLWTEDELRVIAPLDPQAADVWEHRYASLGGVPHLVLQDIREDPEELLRSACEMCPLVHALCGHIFSPHAIDVVKNGGKFTCRKLQPQRRLVPPWGHREKKVKIPVNTQVQVVETITADQRPKRLYVAHESSSLPIDAWIPRFGSFQLIVGKSRSIRDGAQEALERLGKHGNRLYFLLPPVLFKSFVQLPPYTIEQYAICIPDNIE